MKLDVFRKHANENLTMKILIIALALITNELFAQLKVSSDGSTILKENSFNFTNPAILYLGDNNHFIKSEAGKGVTIGTYQIPVGIALNQGSGNVGIGISNPTYKLSFGNGNTNYKTLALYESGSEFYGVGVSGCSFDFWIGNTCAQYRFRVPNGSVVAAITAAGDIFQNNSYARNYYTNSDKRLKNNIVTATKALDKILALRGVYYDMKDSVDADLLDNETALIPDSLIGKNKKIKKEQSSYGANSQSKKQYGLIAQEVEAILPELVSTSVTTAKAVNYTAIIPILIEAMRELNAKNETLEARVKKLEKGKTTTANARTEGTASTEITNASTYLYQNTPNPFSQETQIKYAVPDNITAAFITITDLNGKQIKVLPITAKGESFVIVKANELYAGLFAYTLVVDGNIIDTKRMVIVE